MRFEFDCSCVYLYRILLKTINYRLNPSRINGWKQLRPLRGSNPELWPLWGSYLILRDYLDRNSNWLSPKDASSYSEFFLLRRIIPVQASSLRENPWTNLTVNAILEHSVTRDRTRCFWTECGLLTSTLWRSESFWKKFLVSHTSEFFI